MKIGKRFNKLSAKEYRHYIDNYKKYTDFNTLGIYRSILENEKLSLEDKMNIRDYANLTFGKTFNFLQLKDPSTYIQLTTLGQVLTRQEERKLWQDLRKNQEQILKEKKIKHRNFGDYSKHNCGYQRCPLNGIMIRQGSWIAESSMWFDTDHCKYSRKEKSKRDKKNRKMKRVLIREELEQIFGY